MKNTIKPPQNPSFLNRFHRFRTLLVPASFLFLVSLFVMNYRDLIKKIQADQNSLQLGTVTQNMIIKGSTTYEQDIQFGAAGIAGEITPQGRLTLNKGAATIAQDQDSMLLKIKGNGNIYAGGAKFGGTIPALSPNAVLEVQGTIIQDTADVNFNDAFSPPSTHQKGTGTVNARNGLNVTGSSLTVGGSYSWTTAGTITANTGTTINGLGINAGAIAAATTNTINGININAGAISNASSLDTISVSATGLGFAGTGSLTTGATTALNITPGTTGALNLATSNTGNVSLGNSTGTLTITSNGGLNVTSAGVATASRYVSNVATGTQPYAATSTTLNTNLNADLLDGNHASAFVTGATDTTLTKTGTTLGINLGNANTWSGAQTFQATSNFPSGIWNSSGNVGIGTTNPSTYKLYVNGGDTYSNAYYASYGSGLYESGSTNYGITFNSASGYLKIREGGTDAITILDGGNVGIGTSNPGAKLDIAGSTSTISNTSGNITFAPAANVNFSQGNVGIGTTSPGYDFDVVGKIRAINTNDPNVDSMNFYNYNTITGTTTLSAAHIYYGVYNRLDTNSSSTNATYAKNGYAAQNLIYNGISGNNSPMNALYGSLNQADNRSYSAGVTSMFGAYNYALNRSNVVGTGDVGSMYGSYNYVYNYGDNSTGTSNVTNMIGVYSNVSQANLAAGTTTNGYLFRGAYTDAGSKITNKYGIYNTGEETDYFSGNVGIGTTAPAFKLDVNGIVNATALYVGGSQYIGSQWTTSGSNIYYNSGNVGVGTTTTYELFHVSSSTGARMLLDNQGGASRKVLLAVAPGSNAYARITTHDYAAGNGNALPLIINDTGGNVGIGTTTATYKVYVNGTVYASGSSREYKQNITDLEIDSSKIYNLRPVSFDYKPEYKQMGKIQVGGRQYGLIAEEVASVIPELAIAKEDGAIKKPSNVDYEKLSILLLDQVQKQKKTIDQLTSDVDELKREVEVLKQLMHKN